MLSVVILVPAGITTELLVWRAVEHHPAFETGFSLDSFTYDTVFSHNFIFIDLRAKSRNRFRRLNMGNVSVF